MRGRKVFQPIGFDAFGIHTENYALRVGEDPTTLTARTVDRYRGQLRRLGAAWDWGHEVVTSDPAYYRWTQWLFLRLYRAGLAVRREAPVNWCPSCLTVLANEQLEGERCERCGTRVTQRTMRQWFLRITAYADELLDGLDELDWPQTAKRQQREWIGRSRGVEVDFELEGALPRLAAFTTRPETLFGVTFLAVPPEHPDLAGVATADRLAEVQAFADEQRQRALAGRGREVGGVFSGRHALHPATGARLPVWVAGYVVAGYGTGAVMGVPAHDERDRAFAATAGPDSPGHPPRGSPDPSAGRPGGRRRRPAGGVGAVHRDGGGAGRGGDRRLAGGQRPRPQGDPLPAARLADLATALLGAAHPDRVLRRLRHRASPRPGPAGAAAAGGGLPPHRHRAVAAGVGAGVRAHHLPRLRRPRQA